MSSFDIESSSKYFILNQIKKQYFPKGHYSKFLYKKLLYDFHSDNQIFPNPILTTDILFLTKTKILEVACKIS